MPITTQWLNGRNDILLTTFTGDWTLEEFYDNIDLADQVLNKVDYPFVAIADFTNSGTPPRKVLTISRRVRSARRPHRAGLIFVNFGTLAQMIYRTLARIEPNAFGKWHHASSLKDAIRLAENILNPKKTDNPHSNGASH